MLRHLVPCEFGELLELPTAQVLICKTGYDVYLAHRVFWSMYTSMLTLCTVSPLTVIAWSWKSLGGSEVAVTWSRPRSTPGSVAIIVFNSNPGFPDTCSAPPLLPQHQSPSDPVKIFVFRLSLRIEPGSSSPRLVSSKEDLAGRC